MFPSAAPPADCGVCLLHGIGDPSASRYEIARTGLWVLRHHPDPSPLVGWLFLDSLRHVGGPADFTSDEAAAWGSAVQQASQLVRELTGCDRVYAIAYGEGARHLHLHLVPRFGDDPATAAWSIADYYRAVVRGERPAADPAGVAHLVDRARSLLQDCWLDDCFPGSDPAPAQLQAIRADLAQLHQTVLVLCELVQRLVAAGPSSDLAPGSPASSPSTTLSRRNPERLAAEVQRRRAFLSGEDLDPIDGDTELDLLIDRLHDLALDGR